MRSCFFVLALVLSVSIGCVPADDSTLDFVGTELARTRVDDLAKTLDLVASERQFAQKEFQDKVRSGLSRWTKNSTEKINKVEFSLDEKIEPFMKQKGETAILMEMDSMNFVDSDSFYLQEIVWLSQIFNRLERTSINSAEYFRLAADNYKPSNETTEVWIELFSKLNPSLKPEESRDLSQAFLLFDWITRNTNLLADVDNSKSDLEGLRLNDRESLPAAGVAGTGYQRFPSQVLVLGRADYVDRAKLFMQGLRIKGMDSVMLAVAKDGSESPMPWVVAVSIGGEFYLFDTKLGLPIPGAELGSIATLDMLRKEPELLSKLSLSVEESLEENTKYGVQPDDLKKLTGLIYVSPEAAARRFKVLESQLVGSQQLPYSMSISEVMKRLPVLDGVNYEVWDIGIKTHQFRQAVSEGLENISNNVVQDKLSWYHKDEGYVVEFPRYRTARVRHFQGAFQTSKDKLKLSAIESLEALTYSDETIDSLATDSLLQVRLGILSEDRNKSDFDRRLKGVQGHMQMVRRDTGTFLSQAHFDNGSFGAARNWATIALTKDPNSKWNEALSYMVSRAAESQKDYDTAIADYRKNTKSLQAPGNILRARLLQQAVTKVYGKTSSETEKED